MKRMETKQVLSASEVVKIIEVCRSESPFEARMFRNVLPPKVRVATVDKQMPSVSGSANKLKPITRQRRQGHSVSMDLPDG